MFRHLFSLENPVLLKIFCLFCLYSFEVKYEIKKRDETIDVNRILNLETNLSFKIDSSGFIFIKVPL